MRSVAPMKVAKIGYIFISAALCFFGILLIVDPEISLAAFGIDYDRPLNLCHRISFIFLQIYPPHIKIVIIFHSKYDIQENVLSFFHLILTA